MIDTYIISLNPENTSLTRQIKSYDLNPIWFKGVDGKTTDPNLLKYIDPNYTDILSKGVIGCALSHFLLWKQFAENEKKDDNDKIVIFEDDVIFVKGFKEKFVQVLQQVSPNFDVLLLGCILCENKTFIKYLSGEKINENIYIPNIWFGAHAYVLSKQGATKLYNNLAGKISYHIDFLVFKLGKFKKINVYSCIPRLCYQTSIFKKNKKIPSYIDTNNNENVKFRYKSQNVTGNYPILIYHMTRQLELDKFFTLDYFFFSSAYQYKNFPISGISMLMFSLGIFFIIKSVNIFPILIGLLILSIPDLYNNPFNKNIYFNVSLLLLPIICWKLIMSIFK